MTDLIDTPDAGTFPPADASDTRPGDNGIVDNRAGDQPGPPDAPFVLGGRLHWSWRGGLAVLLVVAFVALPVRGLYRATGSSMEEGFMLVFPHLVWQGRIPNVDFLHLYGPGSLDILALWYQLFGYTLEAERTFGLLQHLGIIFGIYALTRAWGRVSAVGAAWITALLIMTPIGLSALAWHGAVALALWAVVFAVRATQTHRTRHWAIAGVLAGLALTFRPDIVLAVGAALLFAVWSSRRVAWKPLVIGAVVGLLPLWIHLVVAGPWNVFEGVFLDPVFHLRAGRELPRPPSWGVVDGALQAVAEGLPPWWRLPAPEGIATAVPVVLRCRHHRHRRPADRVASAATWERDAAHVRAARRRNLRARHRAAGAAAPRFDAPRVGGRRVVAAARRGAHRSWACATGRPGPASRSSPASAWWAC